MAEIARQWTTRDLLAWIESHLQERQIDAPRVFARHIVAEALACDVMDLFTDADRPATQEERDRLRALVTRAAAGEPLQQLLGRTMFSFRDFEVTADVLAPRDATESLVRAVLCWHRGIKPEARPDPLLLADIGTGTGCIAITLAAELKSVWAVAVDCSPEALAVAARNIERYALGDRVVATLGNLLEPITEPVHVIVSNPPYINDADFEKLDAVVRDYEPALALRGGPDGLDVIRPLVAAASERLLPDGLLALETCTTHVSQVAELCTEAGLVDAAVRRDGWGEDRIVTAKMRPRC